MRPRMEGLATQIGVAIHYLRTPDLEQRDAQLHFNAGTYRVIFTKNKTAVNF